ncbi:MAG: hypothetical protein ABW087_00305 [Candidatus Thiodiazotropha sp.]
MFKIRKDADNWFRKIDSRGPIKTKFDLFYLCLMLGLKKARLDEVIEGTDIYQKFPQEYEGSRFLVLGLLISAEMNREGLVFEDKASVQKLISKYVAADSPSNLSSEGFKKINGYASGGFDVLSELFEDVPQDVDVFIARYCAIMAS